jgi:hypothetical protein
MIDFQMMMRYKQRADENARLPQENTPPSRSDMFKTVFAITLILMLMGSVIIAMVLSQPVHH